MKALQTLTLAVFYIVSVATAFAGPVSTASLDAIHTNGDGLYAVIATSRGEIVLQLEYKKTPLTVTNFVALAEGTMTGKPFYDGLTFHRVVANFMVQGGDPLGTGTGGPGYAFADEFDPTLRFTGPGILAMANSGPGTNGSQFFITHVKTDWLNGKHSIFGHVVAGQKVVNSISQGDTIDKVTIIRQGKDAQAFVATKASFDALQAAVATHQNAPADSDNAVAALVQGFMKTPSGLYYKVTQKGSGLKPTKGQTILAHYEGRLLDGTVFDSSYARKQPFEFQVGIGNVIPGWDEALIDMKTGEKRTLVIPPKLAYGSQGAGTVIPPNAWLVFDVQLVALK